MLEFLEFILSTIGLTFIITQYYIFENFREYMSKINPNKLGKLFKCPACTGFWIGMIIKILLMVFYGITFTWLSPIIILIYGFIGSFVSYTSYLLLQVKFNSHD